MNALKKARNIRNSLYAKQTGIAMALLDQLIRDLENMEKKNRVGTQPKLDVPIDKVLRFRTDERSKNALKLNRIQTLEEAAELGAEKLLSMPRIGPKVLQQVKLAVEARGGEMRL